MAYCSSISRTAPLRTPTSRSRTGQSRQRPSHRLLLFLNVKFNKDTSGRLGLTLDWSYGKTQPLAPSSIIRYAFKAQGFTSLFLFPKSFALQCQPSSTFDPIPSSIYIPLANLPHPALGGSSAGEDERRWSVRFPMRDDARCSGKVSFCLKAPLHHPSAFG